jgi:hypothetical protein
MAYVTHDSTHTTQTNHTIDITLPCTESIFPQLSVSVPLR